MVLYHFRLSVCSLRRTSQLHFHTKYIMGYVSFKIVLTVYLVFMPCILKTFQLQLSSKIQQNMTPEKYRN